MKKLLVLLLTLVMLMPVAQAIISPTPRPATSEPPSTLSDKSEVEDIRSKDIINIIDVGTLSFALPIGFSKCNEDDNSITYSNELGAVLFVALTEGDSLDLEGVAQRTKVIYQKYFDSVEVDSNYEVRGIPYINCDLFYSEHPWFCKGAFFLDSDNDTVYSLVYKSENELTQDDFDIWTDLLNSISVSYSIPTNTTAPTADLNHQLITFRDAPWGISFTDAEQLFPEYKLSSSMAGEMMRIYPLEEIITDKRNTDFEYSDINIPAYCYNHEFQVAGYTTSNITLYFAYTPVNGILTHKEEDTALYAAKYEFEPADIDAVADDLTKKLSSLYGEIDREGSRSSYSYKYTWSIWWGTDHTGVALTTKKTDDSALTNEIWISYYTSLGTEWLQTASDAEKERLLRLESSAVESGDTSGL